MVESEARACGIREAILMVTVGGQIDHPNVSCLQKKQLKTTVRCAQDEGGAS